MSVFPKRTACRPVVYSPIQTQGFTLIEMAVVVVIVGLVISMMMTVLPTLLNTSKLKQTKAILEKYDYALQGYAIAHNRLPFADSDGDGAEDDAVFSGYLPYKTLGLSSGLDNHNNRVLYAVYGGGVDDTQRLTSNSLDQNEFCDVITDVNNDAFNSSYVFVYTDTDQDYSSCPAADEDNAENQAYVIASGGKANKDGDSDDYGLNFDLCNGKGIGFMNPAFYPRTDNGGIDGNNAIMYDDAVRAFSLGELNQKVCSGGGGSSGTGTTSSDTEDTDELCSDNIDNDGDGKVDCYDQDCCGSGVTSTICGGNCPPLDDVAIDEITLDNAFVGEESYSQTFSASGGSGKYYWYLNSISPSIDGLEMDYWNGILSGTIDVCSGDYTVEVSIEDRNDNSLTDEREFTLVVEPPEATINPESAYIDFEITGSQFEELFYVNETKGTHVGDYEWSINWQDNNNDSLADDPGGIQINPTTESSNENHTEDITAKLWKSSAIDEAGIYKFTITATDTECGTSITSDTYAVEVTEAGLSAPYTENMEGQWTFDECDEWSGTANDVVDVIGKGTGDTIHYGIAQGGVVQSHAGRVCRAASFDGVDDSIISSVLDTDDDIMKFTNEVTLAAWFKSPGGGGETPRIIEFADRTGHYKTSTCLAYNNTGALRAWVTSEGGTRGAECDTGSKVYNDNEWHHAVYTYNDTDGGIIYVDGEVIDTAKNKLTSDICDAETFVIGNYFPDSGHGFNGLIDEVMVFSRCFSQEEVQDLYELTRSCEGDCYTGPVAEYRMENFAWDGTSGEVVDSGSSGSDGVAAKRGSSADIPTQTNPSGGKVCRAGEFVRVANNQGAYLNLGDPSALDPGTDDWSVLCWINWDGSSGENLIYNKENLYEAKVDSGYVQYAWQPNWVWLGGSSFPITANTWVHVTTTYEKTQQVLYKNGEPVYAADQAGSIGSNNNSFLIGARSHGNISSFFGGMIDELKIYNRMLAINEIKDAMNETRGCDADSVAITTSSLLDGTLGAGYASTIQASGGIEPYVWEIVGTNPFPEIDLVASSGAGVTQVVLTGTMTACPGEYDITIKVTDGNSRIDERTFTVTVTSDSLSLSPGSGSTFYCTSSTFYEDFQITGSASGAFEWHISSSPGGIEIISTADNTARLRKYSTSSEGAFDFTVTAVDSNCSSNTISGTYRMYISADGTEAPYYYGMVGEWNFDECEWDGTTDEILDSGDDGYHGQSHNITESNDGPSREQGYICKSAALNLGSTTNQYISLDNGVVSGLEDVSISLWCRLEDLSSSVSTLISGARSGNFNALILFFDDGATICTHIDGNLRTFDIGDSADDGRWHHVVWTRNASTGEQNMYIDSTLADTKTGSTATINVAAGGLMLGQEQDSVGGGFDADQIFQGWIDEMRVYERVLTQDDVNTLYSLTHSCSGSCYNNAVAWYAMDEDAWSDGSTVEDGSGNAYHGTVIGNVAISTTDSHMCNAGSFPGDAAADTIEINNLAKVSTADGDKTTVTFWMNWQGTPWTTSVQRNQMAFGWNASTTYFFSLWAGQYFGINTSGGNIYGVNITDTDVIFDTDSNWHHIAAVFTNKAAGSEENQLFIDGVLQSSSELTAYSFNSNSSVSNTFFISGRSSDETNYRFNGLMDELRIYNRALSTSEVNEDMQMTHSCGD